MQHASRFLAACIALLLFLSNVAHAAATVPHGDLAAERMLTLKLIGGRPTADGGLDLALQDPITRAEFVTIVVRAYGKSDKARELLAAGASPFPDVTGHWAAGSVQLAKEMIAARGMTLGLPDGTFKPDGRMNTAEAVAFLMKFLEVRPVDGLAWPDNYLDGALKAGLISEAVHQRLQPIKLQAADRLLVFQLADQAFGEYKGAEGKTVYQRYVDDEAPVITLHRYEPETKASEVLVSGKVTGSQLLALWPGQGMEPLTFHGDGTWEFRVPLKYGPNHMSVGATDLVGNQAEPQSITITRYGENVPTTLEVRTYGRFPMAPGSSMRIEVLVLDQVGTPIPGAEWNVEVVGNIGNYDKATGTFTAASRAAEGKLIFTAGQLHPTTIPVTVGP